MLYYYTYAIVLYLSYTTILILHYYTYAILLYLGYTTILILYYYTYAILLSWLWNKACFSHNGQAAGGRAAGGRQTSQL